MSRKWTWTLLLLLLGFLGLYLYSGYKYRETTRLESNKPADDDETRLVVMFLGDDLDQLPIMHHSLANHPAVIANPTVSVGNQWFSQPFFKTGFIRISIPEGKLLLIEEALAPHLKNHRWKIIPGLGKKSS